MAKNSKIGRNKEKCKAYKNEGRREINKAHRQEKHKKKLARKSFSQ